MGVKKQGRWQSAVVCWWRDRRI